MGPQIEPRVPALVLAPMEGITDAPMRALQGSSAAFTYAVSEFLRVSNSVLPAKVFRKAVPELDMEAGGLPVQVQLLGGDPDLMAASAQNAVKAGTTSIDINFGCPAPIVNRHDGGASLLRCPERIREIVSAVRSAVPEDLPVSAKLRLGWECIEEIHRNAQMAAEGGASWITIHARTRVQGYRPPVFWAPIGVVRRSLDIPVVANGDIWTFEDFLRCREETGCIHFMLGRSALSNPSLPHRVASELRIATGPTRRRTWAELFADLVDRMGGDTAHEHGRSLMRVKQWMKLAHQFGDFPYFEELKQVRTLAELFEGLDLLVLNAA